MLYAISKDDAEQAKATTANEILRARDLALSVQVLQEFYIQATRATRSDPLSPTQAKNLVEAFTRFPVISVSTEIMQAAMTTCQRFHLSYWDAAIIEAARVLGCDVVLSEDLGSGQDYDGVLVTNPFAAVS